MKPLTVSDHALVRWIERGHGIDLEDVREELAGALRSHHDMGCSNIPVGGMWAVVRNDVVITVVMDKPALDQREQFWPKETTR